MDTRLTADQTELHDTVRRVVADLGPRAVADLDDEARHRRLDDAVEATGVRGLRAAGDGGAPLASGVEAALVAEALGAGPADVAFLGPLLAGDLARRSGLDEDGVARTVALHTDLGALASATGGELGEPAVAIDADGAERAIVLVDGPDGARIGEVPLTSGDTSGTGTDLTRRFVHLDAATPVSTLDGDPLHDTDVAAWTALGLSVAAADAVGAMRAGVVTAVDYAAERRQYGAPVGSFQAVQHLLADAHTLTEGALSITRHAAWAVDALDPVEAWTAAAKAAAYGGRAQRHVAETIIQVYGGIGNTWECMAHVFLRRTLHDDALLGSAESLLSSLADRIGATDGLS